MQSLDARGLPAGYPFNPDWETTPREFRARREAGEHVVLVTDSDLAAWANKPGAAAAPAKYPYAVLELSLAAVAPAGKTSHAGKVIADPAAKTVRLEDFKTAPVALRGVKHIKGGA